MPSVVMTTGTSAFQTIESQSPSFSTLLQETRENIIDDMQFDGKDKHFLSIIHHFHIKLRIIS